MDQNLSADGKPIKVPGPSHPIDIAPNSNRVVVTVAGRVVADNQKRAVAYVLDASCRVTHPLGIWSDAEPPTTLADALLSEITRLIRLVPRTGKLEAAPP